MDEVLARDLEFLSNDKDFLSAFSKLQSIAHETALAKGWWNPPKTFGEQAVLFHAEISEAVEEYRNGHPPHEVYRNLPPSEFQLKLSEIDELKPEGVPIELADLIIRVFDSAEHYNMDLIGAILMKMKYNLSRSHRHGGKVI